MLKTETLTVITVKRQAKTARFKTSAKLPCLKSRSVPAFRDMAKNKKRKNANKLSKAYTYIPPVFCWQILAHLTLKNWLFRRFIRGGALVYRPPIKKTLISQV